MTELSFQLKFNRPFIFAFPCSMAEETKAAGPPPAMLPPLPPPPGMLPSGQVPPPFTPVPFAQQKPFHHQPPAPPSGLQPRPPQTSAMPKKPAREYQNAMEEKQPLIPKKHPKIPESEAPKQENMETDTLTKDNLRFQIRCCDRVQADSTTVSIDQKSQVSDGNLSSTKNQFHGFDGKDGLRYVYHRTSCCKELRAPNVMVSVYDGDELKGQLLDHDIGDYICCKDQDVALMKVRDGNGKQLFALRRAPTCQDMCHCCCFLVPFASVFSLFPPAACCCRRSQRPLKLVEEWYQTFCCCSAKCPYWCCLEPCLDCFELAQICNCYMPTGKYFKACLGEWPKVCCCCQCTNPDITCPGLCCQTLKAPLVEATWMTPVSEKAEEKATVKGSYARHFPGNTQLRLEAVSDVQVEYHGLVAKEEKIAFSTVMMWEADSRYPTLMQGMTRTAFRLEGLRLGCCGAKEIKGSGAGNNFKGNAQDHAYGPYGAAKAE